MNVNWKNLSDAIKKGQMAYEKSSVSYIPISGTNTSSYLQSNIASSILDRNIIMGERFTIGESLWGRNVKVR